VRGSVIASIAALAVGDATAATTVASASALSSSAFKIEYDAFGIRSLKRMKDVYDTDYVAANGVLGRLLVRYRTTPNGDWRELRDLIAQPEVPGGQTITYAMGTRPPTLAARSAATAPAGAAGLRALNDGLVPGGAPGRRAASMSGPTPVPLFSWSGGRSAVQWVQYAFPLEEEVSRIEVFWVTPPQSWRLLYEDSRQWKPVAARGAYGLDTNTFTAVEFAPVRTSALRIEVTMTRDATASLAEWRVGDEAAVVATTDLSVRETFKLDGEVLDWTVVLANDSSKPIEIGDLAVPLMFAERTGARADIYTHKLLRHWLIAGHGSWVYWQRSGGEGPYLVMTPLDRTAFEYYDNSGGGGFGIGSYTPYIHANAVAAAAVATGGNWRLPTTSLKLAPRGRVGATATYSFRFQWAKDFAAVRDVLYEEGKFDTVVVPGMVVPRDLPAMVSLRTRNRVHSVEAEHPASTRIEFLGRKGPATSVYRVHFAKLGENLLTVRYDDGQWTTLEFFVTEPLETLIQKRAAFLVSHHQHTDPTRWYQGVYSDWDQRNEVRRGPEDRDGLSTWLTDANDDAGNARPAFIASKNVFLPDPKEIESLELYIGKYLWGGLQMTDEERYPYGLYGIPNWKANRESPDPGRNGQAHLWRIYDYPHIVMLYFRMYQIARFYPDEVKLLDAEAYLERAYRTGVAYWTVPNEIERWSADAVGTMNEAIIPELIQALEEEGKVEWARTLRGYWEGKVERFVNRTPNLYGSEFAFDSTGFESTGALAKYAMTKALDKVTREEARKFMDLQLLLNMSDRGWLETSYFQLGSDYRGSLSYLLSYMSQMGGWSILDYGLHFASDPTDYLRLGYASSLSAWALVNSGTEASGWGYWHPSPNNDGAAGGGFVPEAMGRGWIGKAMPRGAWHYSAEEDLGYCAALRTHATIVARDPVFGEMAYGGLLRRDGKAVDVIPRDGLRVRFHLVRDEQRVHMLLDHDGYARERPIRVSDDLSRIQFTLENRVSGAHRTGLTLTGLPAGVYEIVVDGRVVGSVRGSAQESRIALPVGPGRTAQVSITRRLP